MAESDRGVHPDLVDDQPAAPAPAEPPRRGRGRSAARASESPPAAEAVPVTAEAAGEAPSADQSPESGDDSGVDWKQAWSQAESPEAAFALLAKNLPTDVLEKHERLSGLIGSRSQQRARDLLRQQERDLVEQRKREAAANNDLYTLGELAKGDYDQQVQNGQQFQQLQPMMDVIADFQRTLPEHVQREVAGKL